MQEDKFEHTHTRHIHEKVRKFDINTLTNSSMVQPLVGQFLTLPKQPIHRLQEVLMMSYRPCRDLIEQDDVLTQTKESSSGRMQSILVVDSAPTAKA